MTCHVGCAELTTACRPDPFSVRRDQAAGVEAGSAATMTDTADKRPITCPRPAKGGIALSSSMTAGGRQWSTGRPSPAPSRVGD